MVTRRGSSRCSTSASPRISAAKREKTTGWSTSKECCTGCTFPLMASAWSRSRVQEGSGARDIWQYRLPEGTATRITSSGLAVLSAMGRRWTNHHDYSKPRTRPRNSRCAHQRRQSAADDCANGRCVWDDGSVVVPRREMADVPAGRQGCSTDLRPADVGRETGGRTPAVCTFVLWSTGCPFSPDGRWIAYATNESGASEVYVQPFPGPGERHRVWFRTAVSILLGRQRDRRFTT